MPRVGVNTRYLEWAFDSFAPVEKHRARWIQWRHGQGRARTTTAQTEGLGVELEGMVS
ncbi:hypothetical protein ACMAY6_08220 [Luminiphilus sp. nBUS_16]|uniref:hypothetical protein n=1 Tax=Luminiphilus sp. nBUS_16 TaxID=3395315 RepID=UPI003EB97898